MSQYCFVIPIYNHPDYLDALMANLDTHQLPIIVVNDGSDQACTEKLTALAQCYRQLTVLQHAENQGKGQAVMTGLRYAYTQGFSHAVQLDADGQHDWQDVSKFVAISQQHPDAMVIGNPVFDASVPKGRLYGRYATHIWVWINSLSFEIKDSMCGFRVYPLAASVKVMDTAKLQPRMGFDSEILVRLKWNQVAFINVPTKVIYPEAGISHFNVWRDNLGMTQTHSRLFAGMLLRLPKLLLQKVKG